MEIKKSIIGLKCVVFGRKCIILLIFNLTFPKSEPIFIINEIYLQHQMILMVKVYG